MKKVYFVMPSLPAYREAFFKKLSYRCTDTRLCILHGQTTGNKVIKQVKGLKIIDKQSFPVREKRLLGLSFVTMPGLYKYFKSNRPDAAIFLFNTGILSFWRVFIYCLALRIPRAVWATGYVRPTLNSIQKRFRSLMNNVFLKLATFHICYGTAYRDRLLKMNIDKQRIIVAQNTIDVEGIVAETQALKTPNNCDVRAFLYVGAVIPTKRLDIAIKAFARLKAEGYSFTFAVIGEGSAKADLSSLVAKVGLSSEISIVGALYGKDLSSYFLNSDVFILPGAGGLAVNEAMAYGLPIISTVGDGTVTDLVQDGLNGYLLKGVDLEEEIVASCKRFMELDAAARDAMGSESLSIVCRVASLDNMVAQFHACITEMTRQ